MLDKTLIASLLGADGRCRAGTNISAALGVAVREFVMLTGEADYLLYAAGKAIGVIEANPKGHALISVESQSAKYAGASPAGVPAYGSPLPFPYVSAGVLTQFTNRLEQDARSRQVFTFHRPEELIRLFNSLIPPMPRLSPCRYHRLTNNVN